MAEKKSKKAMCQIQNIDSYKKLLFYTANFIHKNCHGKSKKLDALNYEHTSETFFTAIPGRVNVVKNRKKIVERDGYIYTCILKT